MALRAGTLARWHWSLGRECFPLMEHERLGLTLHPFDLATNKILAMVGRLEVRDWVDVITLTAGCSRSATCCGRPAAKTRAMWSDGVARWAGAARKRRLTPCRECAKVFEIANGRVRCVTMTSSTPPDRVNVIGAFLQ